VARESDQVRLAEPAADLRRLAEARLGAREVPLRDVLERGGQHQIALLDAIGSALVQQSAGPRDPAATASPLAPIQQAESEPERAADGSRQVAPREVVLMRLRPGVAARLVLAEQVCSGRQALPVPGLESGIPIRCRQP